MYGNILSYASSYAGLRVYRVRTRYFPLLSTFVSPPARRSFRCLFKVPVQVRRGNPLQAKPARTRRRLSPRCRDVVSLFLFLCQTFCVALCATLCRFPDARMTSRRRMQAPCRCAAVAGRRTLALRLSTAPRQTRKTLPHGAHAAHAPPRLNRECARRSPAKTGQNESGAGAYPEPCSRSSKSAPRARQQGPPFSAVPRRLINPSRTLRLRHWLGGEQLPNTEMFGTG